jgi:hypothetical protein
MMRIRCRQVVGKALEECPSPDGGFFGNSPYVWNVKGMGCIDIDIHR